MALASSRVGDDEGVTVGAMRFGDVLIGPALISLATGRGLASWAVAL